MKMFNGPMWKVEPTDVNGDDVSQSRDPVKVDCNESFTLSLLIIFL